MFFAPAIRTRSYAPALRAFDRSFERFVADALGERSARAGTAQQDDGTWTITLDVPGVTREQLVIGIDANVVSISTVADAPRQYKAAYELPQDIDAAASEARLENGVLTLKLAKKAPVSTAVQLTVK